MEAASLTSGNGRMLCHFPYPFNRKILRRESGRREILEEKSRGAAFFLIFFGAGRYMEIHGNTWKYMEIHGNAWKCVEMRGNTWKYVEMRGNAWKYVEIRGNTWKYMEIRGNFMETYRNGDCSLGTGRGQCCAALGIKPENKSNYLPPGRKCLILPRLPK